MGTGRRGGRRRGTTEGGARTPRSGRRIGIPAHEARARRRHAGVRVCGQRRHHPKAGRFVVDALARRVGDGQGVDGAVVARIVGDDAAARQVRHELAVVLPVLLRVALAHLKVGHGRRRRRRRGRNGVEVGRRRRRPRRARRRQCAGLVKVRLDVRVRHGRACRKQKRQTILSGAALARATRESVVGAADVRRSVARVPTNILTKGRDDAGAVHGLEGGQGLGDGAADALALAALDAAHAEDLHARLDLAAHKDLERRALERGRRWRSSSRVVVVRRRRARRRRRRCGGRNRDNPTGQLGVARTQAGVHLGKRPDAARDEDAPRLALLVDELRGALRKPVHRDVPRLRVGRAGPEGGDAVCAAERDERHGLHGASGHRQALRARRGVVHVRHLVGNRHRVGVRQHARVVGRRRDADAQWICARPRERR